MDFSYQFRVHKKNLSLAKVNKGFKTLATLSKIMSMDVKVLNS
jgi:hypothetical protein